MTRCVLVRVGERPIEVDVSGVEQIQQAIGCDCFTLQPEVSSLRIACYVDDEGLLNGSEPNRALYDGDNLLGASFGAMLFQGCNDMGEECDLMDWEVDELMREYSEGRCGPGSGREAVFEVVARALKSNYGVEDDLKGRWEEWTSL